MSHSAQVPVLVADYFRKHPHNPTDEHPIITKVFYPVRREYDMPQSRGWKTTGYKKRVSISWLRKLKKEGVTCVMLSAGGNSVDFSIDEILKAQAQQKTNTNRDFEAEEIAKEIWNIFGGER